MKNTIITNMMPPESQNSHRGNMRTKRKEKWIPMEVLSASIVSAVWFHFIHNKWWWHLLFNLHLLPKRRLSEQLISEPYRNWKDAVADLKNHSQCHYHKSSADVIRHFLQTYKNSSCRIDNILDSILDSKLQAQVANNPKILTSFLKCIEFCCRQGIPLRSDRDDDTTFDDNTTMGNSKNYWRFFVT